MTNEKNKVTAKVLGNGDELVIDTNFRYHLFRNEEELTKNVQALKAESYANNYWKYRDLNNFEHLFDTNGTELTADIKTMWVEAYKCNYWKYMTKEGLWHLCNSKNERLTKEPGVFSITVFPNGDWEQKITEWAIPIYVKN